jgi:hypothetical protein
VGYRLQRDPLLFGAAIWGSKTARATFFGRTPDGTAKPVVQHCASGSPTSRVASATGRPRLDGPIEPTSSEEGSRVSSQRRPDWASDPSGSVACGPVSSAIPGRSVASAIGGPHRECPRETPATVPFGGREAVDPTTSTHSSGRDDDLFIEGPSGHSQSRQRRRRRVSISSAATNRLVLRD